MLDSIIQNYSIKGNIVDLIFIAAIVIFIISSRGFIESLFELFGFVGSLVISFTTYSFFGSILNHNFDLPRGIAHVIGFFIAWFLSESLIYIVTLILLSKYLGNVRSTTLNKMFRFVPSTIHACVIYLFFISLIFSLPVNGTIKEKILSSRTGPVFVNASQSFEKNIKGVFGGAISESLNFLTIKPKSSDTVELGFKVSLNKMYQDPESEKTMVKLLNKERSDRGLRILESDEDLREVARTYARQMFQNGFFAHTSKVDGSTVLERTSEQGIIFQIVGENLAFAPDVYLAHQGLMNSEGHRANILSIEYSKVGIGVMDAGIYGRMFVQVFTD